MGAVSSASSAPVSVNFGFLQPHDPLLVLLAAQAERYFTDDPPTALIKLRQFAEVLAQHAAARVGLHPSPADTQLDLLNRLRDQGALTPEVRSIFHDLRRVGNIATHEAKGSHSDALTALKFARQLGIWFHRAFGGQSNFSPGPFIPPLDPGVRARALADEMERLRREVAEAKLSAEAAQAAAQEEERRRLSVEERAQRDAQDLAVWQQLAEEAEKKLSAAIAAEQARAAAAPAQTTAVTAQALEVAKNLELDEAETRALIDTQLREAGWEADTVTQTYAAGARPAKGKNLAIAEWPTQDGPADYVLFIGLTPVGVVEAKRKRKDVAGSIEQSKRYSRGYVAKADETLAGPWADYRVPFLFATNGRAYLQQIRTKSGIWFLDARRTTNLSRPLEGWYTPEGLQDLLAQDIGRADADLKAEPSDYLPLRDYQHAAIRAVEAAIAEGRHEMLLAMATGTGKTRLALCLIYRLLKARRFRRVLFLVDRTALGDQAHGVFKHVQLENLQPLTDIYDVRGLGDIRPEPDTRLHLATVQGMVKRLMFASEDEPPVPVDAYDCIVIDEAHRGYNLDREMTDTEIQYRDQVDYISKYRRVLDHFDAVRIALTATPALHTTQIFGPPIYEYGYRQAVCDGNLVDHEPPIRILTQLNQGGIRWAVGEEVAVYNTGDGQLSLFNTPDEIAIEVDGFNTQVITESFNRTVCRKLAQEIDPTLPGKTMIFCATDAHADLVVDLLKATFHEAYGQVEDDAVQKITGAADKPQAKLKRFKNERLPTVAVTVDLLTTGIDVPAIVNLVFIRRVRSRILYEQMLGRATRRCDDIGKESFRIYDAVDLYSALEPYTSMKPVVTRPSITFAQLVEELRTIPDEKHRQGVLEELLGKLQQKKRRLKGEGLEAFTTSAGMEPGELVQLIKGGDVAAVTALFDRRPTLASFLDDHTGGGDRGVLVSQHPDQLVGTERGYGTATRPDEYLAGFRDYIEKNRNAVDALLVVTQRPRDLTRQQLRELKLLLDQAGYPERTLRTAYQELTNQDIAASIIGFIRQQALGEALVSYEQRVERGLQRVLAARTWTAPQRRWLERIGKQLKQETVVDREALDRGQFQAEGGFRHINKVFDGKLEQVLGDLHEELWKDAA